MLLAIIAPKIKGTRVPFPLNIGRPIRGGAWGLTTRHSDHHTRQGTGEGGYQYLKTFRGLKEESNIKFEQQSVKTFREAQGGE